MRKSRKVIVVAVVVVLSSGAIGYSQRGTLGLLFGVWIGVCFGVILSQEIGGRKDG